MKLNKIEKIIKKTEMECEVVEVTLLTNEEYRRYRRLIPIVGNWWWLRSPRYGTNGLALVYTGGGLCSAYYFITEGGLRPALRLKVSEHSPTPGDKGDKIEIRGIRYTVLDISDGSVYVLSDEIITKRRFDGNSNNWETSELKAYLDDWARREFGLMKGV